VIPENSPLVEKSEWKPTTASVLMKFHGGKKPLEEDQIKQLVAKGVEGLLPEHVAVVYHHVTPKPPPPPSLWWYIGNEVLLIAALAVAVVSTMTSLGLLVRSRRQRSQIDMLREELKAGSGELQSTRI
jgi:type III secretory pathway lipoprotein EscJ